MTARDIVLFIISETTRFISPMEVAAEWVLVIIAALLIVVAPFRRSACLRSARSRFHAVAHRRVVAIVICGVLPAIIRLSLLGVVPVPDASIHDEFSHLLLGDTLAHGRMTNPTHPMWEHFESIHIIHRPTYNSMYPPGQGLFLAFGQVLFHEPWAGVVLSVCLMFAAMCWMMQGWLPPAWALYGTLIAILKFGIVGLWMNSYLSGAVPGIGGALLIGALPRLRSGSGRLLHSLLLGLGLVILMNTRPFEGAGLTLAGAVYLLWSLRSRPGPAFAITRVLLPAGIVLSIGVIFTGYYCWRVTGSPVRMPYQVNRDTYGWPENLAFLTPKQVTLRHKVLQDMYVKEVHNRDAYSSPERILDSLDTRLFENWSFFIGPILTVPLVFLPWLIRDRRIRALVAFLAVIASLNLFQLVLYPYHLGPVVPILFAILAQAIRHFYVRLSQFNRQRAICSAMLLPACLVITAALKQQGPQWGIPMTYWEVATEPHREPRAYIENWLSRRPRQQLVFVRYAQAHSPNQEWVYNHADIDASKVVWAREMDPASDVRLLQYYPDREAWVVEADVLPQRVVRYPGPPRPSEDETPSDPSAIPQCPPCRDSSVPCPAGKKSNAAALQDSTASPRP